MNEELQRHALSAAYGDMKPEMFRKLQVSMANGHAEDEPILLFEGKVLDGWHRYTAGKGLAKLRFEKFKGTLDDAIALVKRKNIRRDLSAAQLIEIELAIDAAHRPAIKTGAEPGSGRTDREIAEAAGVTERTMGQYRRVERQAIPQVKKAVSSGDLSLKAAEKIAQLPPDAQKAAITSPPPPKEKRKPVSTVAPTVGPTQEALDELKERNAILVEENDRLTVLAGTAEDAGNEEREAMLALFEEQKARIAALEHEVQVLKDSRDSYMNQTRELRVQCGSLRSQLAKKK